MHCAQHELGSLAQVLYGFTLLVDADSDHITLLKEFSLPELLLDSLSPENLPSLPQPLLPLLRISAVLLSHLATLPMTLPLAHNVLHFVSHASRLTQDPDTMSSNLFTVSLLIKHQKRAGEFQPDVYLQNNTFDLVFSNLSSG